MPLSRKFRCAFNCLLSTCFVSVCSRAEESTLFTPTQPRQLPSAQRTRSSGRREGEIGLLRQHEKHLSSSSNTCMGGGDHQRACCFPSQVFPSINFRLCRMMYLAVLRYRLPKQPKQTNQRQHDGHGIFLMRMALRQAEMIGIAGHNHARMWPRALTSDYLERVTTYYPAGGDSLPALRSSSDGGTISIPRASKRLATRERAAPGGERRHARCARQHVRRPLAGRDGAPDERAGPGRRARRPTCTLTPPLDAAGEETRGDEPHD